MSATRTRVLLALILLAYLGLGALYAIYTPAWQAPDEPAHYNYVRYLAENGSFPVLHMGDYPHAYLEQIKAARFPPGMSIDNIRYESHQPPLYYVLAAPIYNLAGARHAAGGELAWAGSGHALAAPVAATAAAAPLGLLALRLFSVCLGAGVVWLAYAVARRIFPAWPALALGTAAFVAFLPRHVAATAQVGNDTLAELLLAILLLLLVGRLLAMGASAEPETGSRQGQAHASGMGALLVLGILLGLIAITKTTVYFALALILGVLVVEWRRERAGVTCILRDLCLVAAPAALLALPWYARSLWVYGWPDFLGLRQHDAIVVGQLRTGEFLAQHGAAEYLRQLLVVSFESFWAVFGWQGVFLDVRIYEALAIFCLVVAGGLALHERQVRQPGALSPAQRSALRLLAACALLSLLTYAWYNSQFVQFQGRYLFTALIPVAIAFGLGWDAVVRPPEGPRRPASSTWLLAASLLLLALCLAAWGAVVAHDLPKWPIAMALAGAACLAVVPWLPRRLAGLWFALPYLALPFFSLYALFGAVVPQLR